MAAVPKEFDALESLVRQRRDVRYFRNAAIAPALLQKIVSVADLAPSVGLSQPWRVWQIENPQLRQCMQLNFERSHQRAALRYERLDRDAYLKLRLLIGANPH